MRFFAITTLLTALAVASPIIDMVERRGDKPNSKEVRVEKVTWAGTGCPPGSVVHDIGEDASVVSLSFSEYVAGTGTGMKATDARKNCNVRMTMSYPEGWSYTVASTILRGWAQIPKDCSANLGATYFFSGEKDDAFCQSTFKGPLAENYKHSAEVDTLVWSKCGKKDKEGPMFNVNSQASVSCKKDALLGVDTQDTKFEMKMLLQWKKC